MVTVDRKQFLKILEGVMRHAEIRSLAPPRSALDREMDAIRAADLGGRRPVLAPRSARRVPRPKGR